jgi:hypothetical protein
MRASLNTSSRWAEEPLAARGSPSSPAHPAPSGALSGPLSMALVVGLLTAGLALSVSGSARAAAPQPGDVDDRDAVVRGEEARHTGVQPTAVEAAPRPDDSEPAHEEPAPLTGTEPAAGPDDDATRAGGPAPGSADAQVREPPALIQEVTPRVDPDGERTDLPTPDEPLRPGQRGTLPEGIGFGGVPALNYDADNGFGFGIIGTFFYYDGVTRPYRVALTLQLFMTSKLVQDHNMVLDWLRVADLPLRLWMRAGYLQSLTQNYCGLGGDVSCDPAVAEAVARARGLTGSEEIDTFARRFYQRRFISPHATILARYALAQAPARFEITGGYRGFGFIPGTWDDEDNDGKPDLFPYPGSLYDKDFPGGEAGFDSVVQLGFMVDSRDNEPAPTEGVWLEGSIRAASGLIGSTWDWAGANLTLRGYTPVTPDRKLVLANRLVLDGIIGDPPIQELARAGGSFDYYLFGGSEAGRGIRVQRYLGKLRAFNQTELRWRFLDVEFLEQRFGFTTAAFVDAGIVGKELGNPGPMDPLAGFGGALRLSWNENFIIRLDVGFSPIEGYAPSVYLLLGNPF